MSLIQLGRTQWQAYFERFSAAAAANRTTVEATGLGLSGADYLPLGLMAYDTANDALTLTVGDHALTIAHPRQVHVEHDEEWVHALEIVDGDGVRHHVLLEKPIEVRPA